MAKQQEIEQPLSPFAKRHIEPTGDLAFPVMPGAPFATFQAARLPKEVQEADPALLLDEAANLVVDMDAGTLSARVPGLVVDDRKEGLIVVPLWRVDEEALTLVLDVYPHDASGTDLDAVLLVAAMREALGTNLNIDSKRLEEVLLESRTEDVPKKDVVLAKGRPARHGANAKLELMFDSAQSSAGSVREDGSVDFRERGGYTNVTEGDELARVTPASQGQSGVDIFGKELPAQDGAELEVKTGKDVTSETVEGRLVFKAAASGVPLYRDNTLSVSDLLEVNSDVDIASGNVHADTGSVQIKGTVTKGCEVTAQDNIFVQDVVENADIRAGGDVAIGGGVLMEEGATIQAGGTVRAKFFRNATIVAGGDVIAEVDMVNCKITAGGKVITESESGGISGGSIECAGGLSTAELGNDAGVSTSVTLVMPPEEGAPSEEDRQRLEERAAELDKMLGTGDVVKALEAAAEEDRRLLTELFKVRGKLQGQLRDLERAFQESLVRRGEALAKLRIKARKVAHPNVTLRIAGKSLTLNKPEQATQFHWNANKGGIEFSGI